MALLMKQFLTQLVINGHLKVDHMQRFFTHHRAYIFGFEWFIQTNVTDPAFVSKVVPLPFWDPRMRLPSNFDTLDGVTAVAPNAPPPLPAIPAQPTVPVAPPAFSKPSVVKAYLAALAAYTTASVAWEGDAYKAILTDPPVTDTNYLNTAYPGKSFPAGSGLDHPENFDEPHDLARPVWTSLRVC